MPSSLGLYFGYSYLKQTDIWKEEARQSHSNADTTKWTTSSSIWYRFTSTETYPPLGNYTRNSIGKTESSLSPISFQRLPLPIFKKSFYQPSNNRNNGSIQILPRPKGYLLGTHPLWSNSRELGGSRCSCQVVARWVRSLFWWQRESHHYGRRNIIWQLRKPIRRGKRRETYYRGLCG